MAWCGSSSQTSMPPNKMDAKPFLVLDLLDIDDTPDPGSSEAQQRQLRPPTPSSRSRRAEIRWCPKARDRRPVSRTERANGSSSSPSASTTAPSTAKVREQFTSLVTKASRQFLTEIVNDRLKTALGRRSWVSVLTSTDTRRRGLERARSPSRSRSRHRDRDNLEELEGYQIVKAIACGETKPHRITHRDAKSYFAVLLDDNNRKPIARLHFNGRQSTRAARRAEGRKRATRSTSLTRFTSMLTLSAEQSVDTGNHKNYHRERHAVAESGQ